jgi:predicted GNAT superfamily acetyltransferase
MPSLEGLTIRRVGSIAEYDACEELQRRAFGYADLDVVPTNELISADASGGLVLGAFQGEKQIGFCFGLVGREHEKRELYHYSRMVAIDPDVRGRGVAYALKQAQREAVLAQGIDLMRWTFDPLKSENAHLNLHKLGAEAVAYIRDMYGETSSPLHRHGTDRFLVEWRLREPRRAPRTPFTRIPLPSPGGLFFEAFRGMCETSFRNGFVAIDFSDDHYILSRKGAP